MATKTHSDLAYLCRALKAPSLAAAVERLGERARAVSVSSGTGPTVLIRSGPTRDRGPAHRLAAGGGVDCQGRRSDRWIRPVTSSIGAGGLRRNLIV